MTISPPSAGTCLSAFISKRVLELKPKKNQAEIATQAGFVNANMLSMIKNGKSKLAIDRVPALARALECDPRLLFRLALQQSGNETIRATIDEIFGTIVTLNEVKWLAEIRTASNHSDPNVTSRARTAIRSIFGK